MSFCSNCGSSLSEDMKFCSSCGMSKKERLQQNRSSQEKNNHVKQKNKIGILKKIALFTTISFAILLVAVFYIGHKAQAAYEAASNQLQCDTENDGEACLLYANYILEEVHEYDVQNHYLNKACTLIPKTDNPERLANICADAGNLEAACNLEHAKSCFEDGEYWVEEFLKTNGQKKRNNQTFIIRTDSALNTVHKSCLLGYNEGCNLYVRATFHSKYHYLDLHQISEAATQACEAGYQASCYFIKKGYFAAYGNIGELKDNAPLDYIRRTPLIYHAAAFDLDLSGRCTASVNISKYGALERVIELSCNHKAFKVIMEEQLSKDIFFPLLLDGRPERRINEIITRKYRIADERGREFPFE